MPSGNYILLGKKLLYFLNINIPSGRINNSVSLDPQQSASPLSIPMHTLKEKSEEPEEKLASLDSLIAQLQSQDSDQDSPAESQDGQTDSSTTSRYPLLDTNIQTGLANAEVLRRRKQFGLNRMKMERDSVLLKIIGYFIGPVQFVMMAAAVLSAGLRHWVDLGVICSLLLLNATVGFIQEYQAGSIVDELKKTLALKADVLRDGVILEVEACDVVPGDILKVEEGTIISADGRLATDEAFLQIDQSSITGESVVVDKSKGDTCFASCTVKRGEAFLIVTATGDNTFVGRAASLVANASSGIGRFTEVLRDIATILLVLVVMSLLTTWTASFYRSDSIVHILEFTLAITIVGVPVGLPAVVTTTMAVGAAYLAKKQAIVQKLSAIESLAGVEILCSDKTGTLTKNKLSLGDPYTAPGVDPDELILAACLAASRRKTGMDAIDQAFLRCLANYPKAKASLLKYDIVSFQPFDPVSKVVTAVVESPTGDRMTCIKGAPLFVMAIVERSSSMSPAVATAYQSAVEEFASRGFRSLGVARKRGDGPWEALGIVPCSDPPRHDTASTIDEAKGLGLTIKMLTGDAVGIAKETARQLGLGTHIYNAERLGISGGGGLSGSEVHDFVEAADGFAEVFPQHKYNVVEMLQQRGYLVAMTGDGVNDAPSLKKADTGIAVEGASDAARSAADIVFLAPGLSAIIDAIKTSRQIFHRMHAYVVYRIALSIHLELFLGLWIVILNDKLNLQLLVFIAIFADLATLAIAYDKAPYSKTPVKWNLPKLWGMSIVFGAILAAGSWITLTTMLASPKNSHGQKGVTLHGGIAEPYGHRDSILFLEITLTQNWLIFITRAEGAFWSSRPSWQLVVAVLAVDILATVFVVLGWFVPGPTSLLAICRVWAFSLGVFAVLAVAHQLLNCSSSFDNFMHGRSPRYNERRRMVEDFISQLRVSAEHERLR